MKARRTCRCGWHINAQQAHGQLPRPVKVSVHPWFLQDELSGQLSVNIPWQDTGVLGGTGVCQPGQEDAAVAVLVRASVVYVSAQRQSRSIVRQPAARCG